MHPVSFVEAVYAEVYPWLVDAVSADHRDGLAKGEEQAVETIGETDVVCSDGPSHQALVGKLPHF